MATGYSRLENETQNYGSIQPAVGFAQGTTTEFFQVSYLLIMMLNF